MKVLQLSIILILASLGRITATNSEFEQQIKINTKNETLKSLINSENVEAENFNKLETERDNEKMETVDFKFENEETFKIPPKTDFSVVSHNEPLSAIIKIENDTLSDGNEQIFNFKTYGSGEDENYSEEGVDLPVSDPNEINITSTKNTYETEQVTQSFMEKLKDQMYSMKIYFKRNPIVFAFFFGILVGLFTGIVFFCCVRFFIKRRQNGSVDFYDITRNNVYNTTNSTFNFEKIAIPEHKDDTMRLMSAENSIIV